MTFECKRDGETEDGKLPGTCWQRQCSQLHQEHLASLCLSAPWPRPPTEGPGSCNGRTTEQRTPPATCLHCRRPTPQSCCPSTQPRPSDHRSTQNHTLFTSAEPTHYTSSLTTLWGHPLIDSVNILHHTRHRLGHFGNVLPIQSLDSWYWRNLTQPN